MLTTSTGGTSWSTQTSGTTQTLYAVAFVNGGFGWAVGGGGVVDSYGCRAGGLTPTPPASIAWPGATLNGLNRTLVATPIATIDDETGSGAGWDLTATSTTFAATGGKTLPTSAAVVAAVSAAAATGLCTLPVNAVTYPVTVPAGATPPTAAKIYDAALDTGGGPVNLTLTLNLAVPANTKRGSYSSTWTFTLASGP